MLSRFSLVSFRKLAQPRSARKIYLYSLLLGLVSGAVALLFEWVLKTVKGLTLHNLAGVDLPSGGASLAAPVNYYWLFTLPILGGLISGLVVQFYDINSKGAGTNAMINTFHHQAGWQRIRTPIAKFIATTATLSGGGSAGPEGPMAQMGAAFGSLLSRFIGVGPRAMRTLFLAGMAGALGAIFRAPLGAALTAVEVLYREDYESESLVPCIISSVTAYFLFTSIHGFDTTFQLPDMVFTNTRELLIYLVLGIACFAVGLLFVKIYHFIARTFDKIPIPLFLRSALGGLVVGLIGLVSLESMGSGFGFLQELMTNPHVQSPSYLFHLVGLDQVSTSSGLSLFLVALIVFKILATSFTVGSGQSGGVFGPSLFIGGLLGALVGNLTSSFFPGLIESYVPFIVVGMGGFFAGVANAPVAALVMVCELTGTYSLLAPLMVVSIVSIILSRKFSIYSSQKKNKFFSPAHEWDMTNNFLQEIEVKDAIDFAKLDAIITSDTLLKKLFKHLYQSHHTDFIVVDDSGQYLGTLSLRYLSSSDQRQATRSKLTAGNLMETDFTPLNMNDSLAQALERLINYDIDKIGVVDKENKVQGYVAFRDILKAYKNKVEKKARALNST